MKESEKIVGETLQVQKMRLKEDLRRDSLEAVNYFMKFVLSKDPSFANKMTLIDKLAISVTEKLV